MVTKTITLTYAAEDKTAFQIERLVRASFAKIVEENGGGGIKVNSEIQFANKKEEPVLKVPPFIRK